MSLNKNSSRQIGFFCQGKRFDPLALLRYLLGLLGFLKSFSVVAYQLNLLQTKIKDRLA